MTFSEFINEANQNKLEMEIVELDVQNGESQNSFGNGKGEYRADFDGKILVKSHSNKPYNFSFYVTSKGFNTPKKIQPRTCWDVRFDGPHELQDKVIKFICKEYNSGTTKV